MCGLAGVIDLKGRREPDRAQVARMGAALFHRGPDDAGSLFASGLGLAHRRLSILGLEDGGQPLFNEDRSVAVICNGELFDYPERKAELEAKGHMFRTHSDNELIVHLYEEHGEDLFAQLEGQFAFVLIDFARRLVLLARDRVGICPLFWSQQEDHVYFGSEIKALLASGAVAPAADPRGLDHLFTFFALGSRRTAFAGVQAIAPGHYMKIAFRADGLAAQPVERKYWDFDFPDWGDEDDPDDAAGVIDAFESTFARAVEIRLRADVPVVGYLSGGVDSAYVLATAARVGGHALPSFTVRVPDPNLDEMDGALEAARAIGKTRSTVVEAGPSLIADNYAALIIAAESPVLDTSCAALLALSREVRAQGYKVVLTGEGADEGFAGYVWFKIREIARLLDMGDAFRPSTAISHLARKWAAPNLSFGDLARIDRMIGGPHAQSVLYNLVATSRDRYFSAGLKEQLGGHVAYEDLDLDVARMKRWHPLNRSLYLGYKVQLAGLLLSQKGDRVAMANSVETRYPFLDENVITFASRIHPKWKLRRRFKDKYLLRQAAARVLPETVAQRRKAMFRAPLAESFLAEPPTFVRDLISPESLARAGYFDVGSVRRDCEFLAKGEGAKLGTFASLGLGGVVATQLWHHLYLGGGLCELPHISHEQPAAEPVVAPATTLAVA
ncbi:MAG: asparagine synthase (glutamine-hydrolyzing) [Methyloceanibacter sp.]